MGRRPARLRVRRRFFAPRLFRPVTRRNRRSLLLLFLVPAFLLLWLLLPLLFSARVDEGILPIARAQVSATVEQLITDTVDQLLISDSFADAAPVQLSYHSDGTVSAIRTDTAYVNRLCAAMTAELSDALRRRDQVTLKMPVGSLFDSALTAGRGFPVRIKALTPGHVTVRAESTLSDAGINQVSHRIDLHITVEFSILLPFFSERFTVENTVCAGETVIVGSVPWQ